MYFTIGLKKLPFVQNERDIIYHESSYNEELNQHILTNYEEIKKTFRKWGFRFVYVPLLLAEVCKNREIVKYYAPYGTATDKPTIPTNWMQEYMVYPEACDKIPPSLLFYSKYCIDKEFIEAKYQFFGIELDKDNLTNDFSEELRAIIEEIAAKKFQEKESKHPLSYRGVRLEKGSESRLRRMTKGLNKMYIDEEGEESPDIRFSIEPDEDSGVMFDVSTRDNSKDSGIRFRKVPTADDTFDTESRQLIQEVEERIKKLQLKGIDHSVLEQLIRGEERLSRLVVTKNYEIILPDYKNMKIEMKPLPKALYLLFLHHPEGIVFKHLPDYQEELLDIYSKVKGGGFFRLFDKSSQSISDVTNPLKDSINEKCARIREAFVTRFDERLAQHYYIDGKRGEAKKIQLPPDMIIWE